MGKKQMPTKERQPKQRRERNYDRLNGNGSDSDQEQLDPSKERKVKEVGPE